jgi:hypothetical protein
MGRSLCMVLVLAAGAFARDRIDFIEFFACHGLDVDAIRTALPYMKGTLSRTMQTIG